MATSNPSAFDGPVRKTPWWRRRWSTGERVWAALLVILILILIWVGLKKNEIVTVKPASTQVTETQTATRTIRTASEPGTSPSGTVTESVTRQTVTAQTTPRPAVLPPPAAPRAQASAPQTATKAEKKTERKVAKAETPPQQSATKPSAPKTASTAAQTGKPFAWTHVGGDPCNPKTGCTLAWALEQSKWPSDVQSALMAKVRGESPGAYVMKTGWQGWMTWGQYERKFRSNTLAAWPSGHTESADLWSVSSGSTSYHLVRVAKCKNWGGFTTSGPAPMQPAQPASSGMMPLGVIPVVACPD